MRIGIIDYKTGNPVSIYNMLNKSGIAAFISGDPGELASADKLILPGIGAWDEAMGRLQQNGIDQLLHQRVINEGIPILGICLGMQLFTSTSEEGELPGLGWINGEVTRLKQNEPSLKIPHIGWREVKPGRACKLFQGLEKGAEFYFSHSYQVICLNENDVVAESQYGQKITAGIQHNNIIGVQFHPEKSGKNGAILLNNFAQYF